MLSRYATKSFFRRGVREMIGLRIARTAICFSLKTTRTTTSSRIPYFTRQRYLSNTNMSQEDSNGPFTTNAQDQEEAAKLKARLASSKTKANTSTTTTQKDDIPSVSIDDGIHKYVLINAESPTTGQERTFVVSRKGAAYHRNIAEPFAYQLEAQGYGNIRITGGGRINCNAEEQTMSIYGYSYGFGMANHAISQQVVSNDERYKHYNITISNEGY